MMKVIRSVCFLLLLSILLIGQTIFPTSSANAATGLMLEVDPATLTCNSVIDFEELDDDDGDNDGYDNYDTIMVSGGVSIAERFQGQTLSASGFFDVLSSTASNPLTLQVGEPNENVLLSWHITYNHIIGGLGNGGLGTYGEGSLAILFNSDQSQVGFEVLGTQEGTATVNFFRRDGSLIDTIVLDDLLYFTNEPYGATYGFVRDGAVSDIAGISIHNDDPDGLGIDNICYDYVALPNTIELEATPISIDAIPSASSIITATVRDIYNNPVEDGTEVIFETDNGTLEGSTTVTKYTSGGIATATLQSESSSEIIIASVTATADGISDATAVFFVPSGQTLNDIQTEIIDGDGTLTDTLTGGDITIEADGEHIVTVAEYQGNPKEDTVFRVTGNFVDVHLNNADGVISVTIQFCPANPNTKIFFRGVSGWEEASDYEYDETSGCVTVTITDTTEPNLADLAGLIFVPGETVIEVEIDIKPGSDPNSINLKSKGVVPVAILTTDTFDAADVDPVTVTFAGASPLRWAMEDVDDDGDTDIVFHFKTQELVLDSTSEEAILQGSTFGCLDIEGVDSVKISNS